MASVMMVTTMTTSTTTGTTSTVRLIALDLPGHRHSRGERRTLSRRLHRSDLASCLSGRLSHR